jgi:RND family efflux transporter MFP subunit
MKRLMALFLAALIVMSFTGCSKDKTVTLESRKQDDQIKAVKVQKVEEGQRPATLDYVGTVDAKEIIKYSFKVPGQIGRIYVEKGEYVEKGDRLADLYTSDLGYQAAAAKALMDTASLNITKAKSAMNYSNSLYEKIDNLYKNGSISKNQYEQVKLQKEVSASECLQAKSQYDAAKVDFDYKSDLLRNSVIYADKEGYVVEKIFNENERIGAYMPVIVVRSGVQRINVGIPQQDLSKVSVGSNADVVVDGEKVKGVVANISEAPDMTTRTYNAEISVEKKKFRLGSIASVSVGIGNLTGVWIPVSAVLSDGESYVYIVKDGRAFKRTVEQQQISDDNILVNGVKNGELLVISGMKNLNDGSSVEIEK